MYNTVATLIINLQYHSDTDNLLKNLSVPWLMRYGFTHEQCSAEINSDTEDEIYNYQK